MSERTGGCACGAIRFSIASPLRQVAICHCADCQKASGGSPTYVALASRDAFKVVKGEAKIYVTKGDSGADAGRAFCPACGSPLWSIPPHLPCFAVKLGALDDNSDLRPSLHLYTSSAQRWHLMHEGLPTFPKMPRAAPPAGQE